MKQRGERIKFKTIYDLAVKKGIKEDLRSRGAVEETIKESKKEYRKTKGVERKTFDVEKTKQPYADTRMLYGSPDAEVKTVMVGIDIDVQELLLADRLREKGVNVDLVISHHPSGRGYAQLHEVMNIQAGIWEKYGLEKKMAKEIMKHRLEQVARGVAPANHTRAVDAAKILKIPFMCCHTVADNCVANYLQKLFSAKKPKKLKNVVSILRTIPEYKEGMASGAGPFILAGEGKTDAGKILVDMTGGTSGPDRVLPRLSQLGIKTLVGMHCRESAFKVAKHEFLNYVIAGHIASDNLGMNLLFDAIEKRGKLKFIECSGFKRVRRK